MELQDNTSGPSYAETGTFGKHLHLRIHVWLVLAIKQPQSHRPGYT